MIELFCLMYMIPTFVAFCRGCPRSFEVLLLNVLFGWTVIGWFIALRVALARRYTKVWIKY